MEMFKQLMIATHDLVNVLERKKNKLKIHQVKKSLGINIHTEQIFNIWIKIPKELVDQYEEALQYMKNEYNQ